MFDPILLVALLTTVLLGGAFFRVLRSERRRANLEPLLSTIAMNAGLISRKKFIAVINFQRGHGASV